MRSSRAFALAGLGCSFVGCALLTNLDDLRGDAGGDAAATDVVAIEASADVVSPPPDAGADCGHLFCDDFDEETLQNFYKWDSFILQNGTVSFSSDAVSEPNALDVSVMQAASNAGPTLSKSFGAASKIHFEVDLRGDCGSLETDLVSFDLSSPPAAYSKVSLGLYESPAGAHFALDYFLPDGGELDTPDDPIGIASADFANWHHYAIDIDFGNATFNINYTTDAGLQSPPTIVISPALPTSNAFVLTLGITSHAALSTSTCDVYFDNVTLDTP